MFPTLTLCAVFVALGPVEPPGSADPEAIAAYRDMAAKAGRGAEVQVRLALWCDAHGLEAERVKHLALAVLTSPENATARGLLGLVNYAGRWQPPQEVAARVKADESLAAALAEYNARRATTPDKAEPQWKLALWCEQKGLSAEAKAHLTAVTRLDPSREAPWKHLGYRKHGGRWMTPEQVAEEKAEAAAQHKADAHWIKRLESLRRMVAQRGRRGDAERGLADVTDPRATHAVWSVFARGGEAEQKLATELFGHIDAPDASLGLTALAVYSPAPEVRRAATETLTGRDPRDVVGKLVELIRTPLKYEVRFVGGPGRPGVLFVEGERFNIQRVYNAPAPPRDVRAANDNRRSPAGGGTAGLLVGMIVRVSHEGKQHGAPAHHAEPSHHPRPEPRPEPAHQAPEHQFTGPSGGGPMHQPGMSPGHGFATPGTGPNFGPALNSANTFHPQTPVPASTPSPFLPQIAGSPFIHFDSNPMIAPQDPDRDDTPRRREAQRAAAIAANWLEAQRAAASSEQRLEADLAAVQTYNADAAMVNERVLPVIQAVTGQGYGADRPSWEKWWADQRGYAYTETPGPKPTFIENVGPLYQPSFVDRVTHSCFGAGTPVRTIDGTRPIETLRVGDRVLSQDPKTGALSFQPVLAAFHNRPAPTLKVDLGGDTPVVVTAIHRFWRAGKGWAMARELKPGDVVRTLGGTARVVAVSDNTVQPVFNLEVADGHSFFVGGRAALVHDNSPVRPTHHPFDAPAEVASARPVGRPG